MSHDAASQLALGVKREFRRRLMEEQLPRITRCAELLGDDRIWQRPSANTNSVGNLMLHLAGNTTQWILAQFTDQHDHRQRDTEFAADGGGRNFRDIHRGKIGGDADGHTANDAPAHEGGKGVCQSGSQ